MKKTSYTYHMQYVYLECVAIFISVLRQQRSVGVVTVVFAEGESGVGNDFHFFVDDVRRMKRLRHRVQQFRTEPDTSGGKVVRMLVRRFVARSTVARRRRQIVVLELQNIINFLDTSYTIKKN